MKCLFSTLVILLVVLAADLSVAPCAESNGVAVARLEVFPVRVDLNGRDSRQQLLVSAWNGATDRQDVTRSIGWKVGDPSIVAVDSTGVAHPLASGATEIVATYHGQSATIPVTVTDGESFLPLDFTNDIAPILTKAGCNGGGCHGKTSGQGGFRISLFGFHPRQDHELITREARGRRLFVTAPKKSLLLQKPTMAVPHGGGRRLDVGSPEYQRLVRWIGASAPWGSDEAPRLTGIEVSPPSAVMGPAEQQQFLVMARYSDGSRRDVTRVTQLSINDTSLAEIDENAIATTLDRVGETYVIANYQGETATAKITRPLRNPKAQWPDLVEANFIDRHIFAKLKDLRVAPSQLAGDEVFLRRVTMQLAGRIPTREEVADFLADESPEKRRDLISKLAHSGEYADHFAQKWSAILRNKRRSESARIPATIAFHRWVRNSIATNKPYDRFVRELITATGNVSVSPEAQWYAEVRYLDRYVDDTAQVFLGTRIGCARCHHHPFEKISQEDYYGLAAFFARLERKGGTGVAERRSNETVYLKPTGEVKHPVTGAVVKPHGLGGPELEIPAYADPRHSLVDWMADPSNPYFAKAYVNRMWAHFFGRGIVEPLDDLRATNPPSNAALLDALADEFVRSGFDMRHIAELICNSTTYQLSSQPNADNLDEVTSFSRFYPQRVSAEVLSDAIDAVTEMPTNYGGGLPPGTRAVQLPDEGYSNKFLELFGRPDRESACECEREASPSLSQSLFLMNDNHVLGKVMAKGGAAAKLAVHNSDDDKKIRDLFLTALSREPTPDELSTAVSYLASEQSPEQAYGNLMWTLLNTKEFMFIH